VASGPLTASEIEAGKVMAVLVYAIAFVFPFFWIVPLVMRDNRFSLYHAKQGLVWFVVGVIGSVVLTIGTIALAFVTCGFGVLLAWPVAIGFWIFLIVLNIIGLVNAAQGSAAPLPMIGRWGERWFAGINVVPTTIGR
jgi:uncharacterized membrane protein